MKPNTNDIDELIAKYLAGEAGESERFKLEAWLRRDSTNQEYFDGLRSVFEQVTGAREWHRFDTDAAWGQMKSRIQNNPSAVPLHRHSGKWFYLSIAASLLFFMAAGVLIYQWNSNRPNDNLEIAATTSTVEQSLPDGSTAFLNKESTMSYAFFPADQTRKVILEGEAYFEVDHDAERPFVIESRDVMIKDLGTSFNVRSYPGEPVVEVLVVSGEVAFYTRDDKGIRLEAGERGLYDRRTKSFSWFSGIDANDLAYKTRTFSFENADLASVVESLNKVYEKKLVLASDKLSRCQLNVSFKGEDIDAIADIIAETLGLTMVPEEDRILLEGTGCSE